MMQLFFLTTLTLCLSLIAACDNVYGNVKFNLYPPEGAECTHQDTQKIMKFVTKAIQRNANKFLALKGYNEKFDDFELEEVRRRDLEGEDTEEMTNSQEEEREVAYYVFQYRGSGRCEFCPTDDRDRRRRGLGFLLRRANSDGMIDWDKFEPFMNEKMPQGLKGITKNKPTSEECVAESLGDWSGQLMWESTTCED